MYRIQLDPGSWAQYIKRADNIGLPLNEVSKKYIMESNLYATQLFEALQMQQQSMQSAVAAGASAPSVSSPLPSNCIEFVFNTTSGTNSSVNVTTSGPTNFTMNWGDGTIFSDAVDGSYDINHTYADLDQSYTCRLCFDNITLVTELDFPGND